jgi:hypothetical protein
VLKTDTVPQKIQGLVVARGAWWPMSRGVPDFIYFLDRPENVHLNYPLFARPAPVRPRHGFVESRVVKSHQELLSLFERVKEVDPEGGLILMYPLRADWNSIITPSGVAVGPGNDGATSGKGAYTIPSPSSFSWLHQGTFANAGVSTPYIEVVGKEGEGGYIVQLRDGPSLAPGQDFIPREVRVEKVIVLRGDEDLLDWERACAVLRQEEGAVVYHPGGAVSSHYGVHCVLNGIPYVTSHEPKVGSRLKPTAAYRWSRKDFREVAERVPLYPYFPLKGKTTHSVPLAFAVVHSLGSFLASPPNEAVYRLIAWALAALVKASAMASVGELRYIPSNYRSKVPPEWEDILWYFNGEEGLEPANRFDCYEGLEDWSLDEYGRALGVAYRLFAEVPWPHAYGGQSWAKSTRLALRLYQALRDFVERPTRARLRKAGEMANRLVNAVHNNGWYLDKFVDKRLLDIASDSPGYVIGVRGEVAAIVYKTFVKASDLPKVRLPRILARGPVDLRDEKAVRRLLRKVRLPYIEPPEDNVFSGQVTLDFNDHAHLQVSMPRVNRDYGLAFDVDREEPQALLLAAYWHGEVAKGTPPARSLNSSDSDSLRYFPVEVQVVGGKPKAVGVNGVWVALGG